MVWLVLDAGSPKMNLLCCWCAQKMDADCDSSILVPVSDRETLVFFCAQWFPEGASEPQMGPFGRVPGRQDSVL